MQSIPCSVIEWSGFYEAWPKASWLNAVDSMQRHWMQRISCIVVQWIPTVCTGVHEARPNASRLNAVDFFAAWSKASRLNAGESMQHDWMQCTPFSVVNCIPIECSGFHAAWLNAEDSMHCGVMDPDCMQRSPCSVMTEWIPCSLLKCILIECSGFHAAWLNAVDSMQPGKMHPDWMQWITCSMIECSGFYAAWPKASWLNAVDYV